MTDRFTPGGSQEAETARPADRGSRMSSIATWLLLLGGGFMACWGVLVTIALVVILFVQGPGSGGPVPFLLGAVVIGLFPIGFGAAVYHFGRQRRRQMQLTPEGE